MNLGTATILRANARTLPLPDDSVDLIVTSPPYFALRSYQDGGEHYDGQLGSEPTPAEFLDALIEVTRECVRVLKPSGSLWVNLGDKYATGATPGPQSASTTMTGGTHKGVSNVVSRKVQDGVRAKSLIGIPWRYAIRCIDELGLILRAEVIWSKPNGLPESVTDRVRRSHEQWFHFTLEPRYYSAVDEIREPHAPASLVRYRTGYTEANNKSGRRDQSENVDYPDGMISANPLGKLPGSVWTVPTEPLRVPESLGIDHFAAFPTEWPKRLILGWSPSGVCTACGEGRRPVVASVGLDMSRPQARRAQQLADKGGLTEEHFAALLAVGVSESCACPDTSAPTTPAVVLDPFGGTGTTAMVAKALGRHGISVDLSADYCRLATWRTNDRDQLAKVLGIAKSDAPTQEEALF